MVDITKVTGKRIRGKAKVDTFGQMEKSITEGGKKESSMVKEHLKQLQEKNQKDFGIRVKELSKPSQS